MGNAYNEVVQQLASVPPSCFLSTRDDGTLMVNCTSGDWDRAKAYGGRFSDGAPQDAVIPPMPGGSHFRLSLPPGATRDESANAAWR